jgi:hypothetical protein
MDVCHRKHIYISGNDDISANSAIAIQLVNQGDFFSGLEHIGYAISILVSDDPNEDYNCTDCITTAKALTKLFSPITKSYRIISGNPSDELQYLLIVISNCVTNIDRL